MSETKQKMPVGMILILILLGFGMASLLFALRNPMSQLGPTVLMGAGAIIINLIMISISGVIFFGIIKRLIWVRKFAIGWEILTFILGTVNILFFLVNKTMFDKYYSKVLTPEAAALMTPPALTITFLTGFALAAVVEVAVIWYLWKKKDFFTN